MQVTLKNPVTIPATSQLLHKHKRREGANRLQVYPPGLDHQANMLSLWALSPAVTHIMHKNALENAISWRKNIVVSVPFPKPSPFNIPNFKMTSRL